MESRLVLPRLVSISHGISTRFQFDSKSSSSFSDMKGQGKSLKHGLSSLKNQSRSSGFISSCLVMLSKALFSYIKVGVGLGLQSHPIFSWHACWIFNRLCMICSTFRLSFLGTNVFLQLGQAGNSRHLSLSLSSSSESSARNKRAYYQDEPSFWSKQSRHITTSHFQHSNK